MSNTVIFRTKGDDIDISDIWDDTALIKAYDKAINSVKGGASNEESGGVGNGPDRSSSANRRKKRKHAKQSKNKKRHIWKVGDRCRAIYTEDEYIYDAVIKLIDHDMATCWVTFIGYGNEEEKDLDDLMSVGSETASSAQPVMGDFEAGYESVEFPKDTQSPAHSGSEAGGHIHDHYQHNNSPLPSQPFITPAPAPFIWPPHPMSHSFTSAGHYPYSLFPGSGHIPQGLRMSIPSVAPPMAPPPTMPKYTEVQEADEEALHTMLMSWYMSGYHTGYYQGLKDSRSTSQQSTSQRTGKNQGRQTDGHKSKPKNSGIQSR